MTKQSCTIVGMGRGIGFAIAKKFGQEGFKINMIARSNENLEKMRQQLVDYGVETNSFITDVSHFSTLESTFDKIHAVHGETDVLVYNAAVMRTATPSNLAADILMNDFKINTVGALVAAQQVIPGMKTQQRGTILFTGGGFALCPEAQYATLSIGKTAIRSLAFMLHTELLPFCIHVATVTVTGVVQPNTYFDPNEIAKKYWELHIQEKEKFEKEIIY